MAPRSPRARIFSSIFLKSPLGSARMSESSWIDVCDREHWTADGTSPTSAVACLPGSSQIFAKRLSHQPVPKVITVSTHRQLGRKFSCAEKSLPNLAQGAGHKSGGVHSQKRLFPRIGLCLNKPQETLCARGPVEGSIGFLARCSKVAQTIKSLSCAWERAHVRKVCKFRTGLSPDPLWKIPTGGGVGPLSMRHFAKPRASLGRRINEWVCDIGATEIACSEPAQARGPGEKNGHCGRRHFRRQR